MLYSSAYRRCFQQPRYIMRNLYGVISCCVLLSLAVVLDNAYAKKPQKSAEVSSIYLDVLKIRACAAGQGCSTVGGPKQINLFDLAEGKTDFAKQVLLPARTHELRLLLGKNSTIAVDGQTYPLEVPSGQDSGLKLKGQKVFGKTGGFLADITLDFDLAKGLVVTAKKVKGKGKKPDTMVSSYSLKPVIEVASVEIEPLPENMAAVVAMPGEENKITLGEKFSLFIPAGAVTYPMVISAKETKYTVEVMDEETGDIVNKTALSSDYELQPDGAEFAVPLEIAIPYSTDTLPGEVSEDDLDVYLDREKIPTDIDTASKIAVADVWHFTSARVSYYTPICPSGNGLYCGSTASSLDDNTLYYCQNGNYQAQEYCFNGCETMPSGANDRCSSGTAPQPSGNFVFPFDERDSLWQICQGYNTPNISHFGNRIHSFDFAYGSGNLGNTGCSGNPAGSEDKTVVAPAAGTVLWNGDNDTDITCFQLENTVSNGHGAQIASVKLGHMKSNSDRVGEGQYRAQGEPIGKLCGPTGCPRVNGYAHTHIGAYTTTNCTGKTVPFGTVFGSGYDFSSDGSLYQWHGTETTICPSGNGLYCGSSQLNQNENTLYYCQDGDYQVQEQCANGCEVISSGAADRCKDIDRPAVDSVSPNTATLNEPITFTVTGQNLPSTLAFWISECENVTSLGGSSTSMRFSCTPSYTTGEKNGVIKDAAGGTVLKEFTINVSEGGSTPPESSTCTSGSQTVTWQGRVWQRCDDGKTYTWQEAKNYCDNLALGGYSDWRLPTNDELRSLVVCTNGTPTPLAVYPDDPSVPYSCDSHNSAPYDRPTISSDFECKSESYWSSSPYSKDTSYTLTVDFDYGWSSRENPATNHFYVRCVR